MAMQQSFPIVYTVNRSDTAVQYSYMRISYEYDSKKPMINILHITTLYMTYAVNQNFLFNRKETFIHSFFDICLSIKFENTDLL